jgi:hypothetical protein
MEENNKKEPVQPEKGLMDKAKDLLDKADDMLDESVEKVKKSKAFGSVTEAYKKAEGFVEDKIDDFGKSGIKEKLETMADNAGEKADKAIRKIKDFGKDLAEKAEAKIDEISGKSKGKPNV